MVMEVDEPGRARIRLTVDPAWHNPNGVLHGGVIYAMADSGMGIAISSGLPEGEHCATIEIKINYLATVREGTLISETEVVKQGRNIVFAESRVTDGQGRLVATASGSMFIVRPGPQG
jgi:acyl-CoA thioesterase